jgi:hypothetical protein
MQRLAKATEVCAGGFFVGDVWTTELERWIRARAVEAGFDLCGVAGLEDEKGRVDGARFGTE